MLKYLPSLTVRKRYIGDHDHAVLATRASGTGNSARSLVYADGILLSNLLGNGANYTPRWGLVTPEEIERVDVLYGPFSAAYPGNSAGAVVDYVTRMPTRLEAHVKLQGFSQRFRQHGSAGRFGGGAASASVGSKEGAWSWWINANRLDSEGQPLSFATRRLTEGAVGVAGVPVTGFVAGRNPRNEPWWILGDSGQTRTTQNHAKLKLAYDVSPTLRASYAFAHWHSENTRTAHSYLRDAAGNTVSSGTVNIDGWDHLLTAADFPQGRSQLTHSTHGFSLKSHTQGTWDWEAAASVYSYDRDRVLSSGTTAPGVTSARAGETRMDGSGWHTLALKGVWRPQGLQGEHIAEFGAQHDAFKLRTSVARDADDTLYRGDATLRSLWAQDAWRFAPDWKAVFGARAEHWRAFNGAYVSTAAGAPAAMSPSERDETHISPKAAVSYRASDDLKLKASLGRAVRMPTVTELYQVRNNDPALRPERSWTTEWTAERALAAGLLRGTVFAERTVDALYSQTSTAGITSIQNVGAIRTLGLELAGQADNVAVRGVDVSGSLTYTDSRIVRNDLFPASVGHWQPRVPRWRANLLATWRVDDSWRLTLGSRYSGKQYGTPNNVDPNGASYTGFSRFWVTDVRAQYRIDKSWTASLGIDNLNNATYWAFHPYTQRTVHAELRFDL